MRDLEIRPSVKAALWRRGELRWKLDPCKREIYAGLRELVTTQAVLECARKVGKSFLLCLVACETALREPGCRINYACPTSKQALEIVLPIMAEIQDDVPESHRAVWNGKDGHFVWPNGSYMVLFGCEDELKADRGRGPKARLSIVDEAGFIRILEYVLDEVLAPQHIRNQVRGLQVLVSSTPPKSPGHDFNRIADAAMAQGARWHRDIFSPGIDGIQNPEAYIAERAAAKNLSVEAFKRTGGYKREFLALRVIDEEAALVPEFNEVADTIVTDAWKPPPYRDRYVSCDPAYKKHFCGVLFAWADFVRGTLVVEDELLLKRKTTPQVGDAIVDKERELWGEQKVYSRVIDDVGERMIADLRELSRLHFVCAQKPDRPAGVALMRMYIAGCQVIIHPRCVQLIHQLRTATVDDAGNLEENEVDGHFDLAGAALVYLVRDWHANKAHNPYPPYWDRKPGEVIIEREQPVQATTMQKAILGRTSLGRRLLRGKAR